MIKKILTVLLFGLALAQGVLAAEHTVERGRFEDASGRMAVDEIAQQQFTPYSGIIALGFTDSVHWVRVRVLPSEEGGRLRIVIRPSFFDQVSLYQADPTVKGGWRVQQTGDRIAWNDRSCPSIALCFDITPRQATTYYLRMVTAGTFWINVNVGSPQDVTLASMQAEGLIFLYFLFMLGILVWASFNYWSHRDAIVAWFIFSQSVFIVYSIAVVGLLAPLFPNSNLMDETTNVLILLAVLTQIVFHHQFLSLFQPPKVWMVLIKGLILFNAFAFIGLLLGNTQLALKTNALTMFASAWLVLPTAWMARQDNVLKREALRLPYLLKTLVVLAALVPVLWGAQGSVWSIYSALIIGLVSAGLMMYLLFVRSQTHQQLKLELERQQHLWREQSLTLSMFSHELKTPLSVLRYVLGIKNPTPEMLQMGEHAIVAMNGMIEKGSEASQLESGALTLRPENCNLATLIDTIIEGLPKVGHMDVHIHTPGVVCMDLALLRIVLNNLIHNAIKYGDTSKPIGVEVKSTPHTDGLCVIVSNYPGQMGWPDSATMFKKYSRGTMAYRVSGAGLGLYLAKGFAEKLGAKLIYSPTQDKVEFCLFIPKSLRVETSATR